MFRIDVNRIVIMLVCRITNPNMDLHDVRVQRNGGNLRACTKMVSMLTSARSCMTNGDNC